MRSCKGTNGTPTSRSDVRGRASRGSPSGREVVGDGAAVVVGAGESPVQGEGRQVDRDKGEQGRRDAEHRPRLISATGEPDALKGACPVREGATGQRTVWQRSGRLLHTRSQATFLRDMINDHHTRLDEVCSMN